MISDCQITKIENVESNIIEIKNSKCSFQIEHANEFHKYYGDHVNFYMERIFSTTTLLFYNNSEEIKENKANNHSE